MSLSGVCTIALTPFTEEGDVDLGGIDSLTDLYLDSGAHGLTPLGIMGEVHKLSDNERRIVMQCYISAADGRVPVIVGYSAAATRVAIERAREAESIGAAAVMVPLRTTSGTWASSSSTTDWSRSPSPCPWSFRTSRSIQGS